MSERLVIDCNELWERTVQQPGLLADVQAWLRANSIDASDVPVHSEMVIEDSAFGMVIRYTAYLRDEDGNKYLDPADPDWPASQDRTAVLRVAPPADWLTTTGGER
ncbi:hypothetical protein [Streptomyces sp. NPDC002328]|uniref:hypothetical protein n=1 Tax=Streptomyces sp. NPDC002328 TaxID=3364642 RepID=UPI003684829F